MLRATVLLAASLAIVGSSGLAASDLHFVTPHERGQVFGSTRLEVGTTAERVDRVEFFVDGVLAGVVRKRPFAVMYDFGETIAVHRITARLSSNGYRDRHEVSITTAALSVEEQIAVDLVEVPIRLHSRSRPAPKDLLLRENGKDQTLLELRRGRAATRFAFVVDRSLSMGDGKLVAALTAIEKSLSQLREDDTAQIILFNHRVSAARDLRRNSPVASLPVGTPPSGGTSLRDALASLQPARRTVAIVISDGDDRSSRSNTQDALRRIGRANVVVYALTLGEGNASDFLRQAASQSGGQVIRTARARMDRDLEQIFVEINSRYTAVYQSTATTPGWRGIEVRSRVSSISVEGARKGYYAQ